MLGKSNHCTFVQLSIVHIRILNINHGTLYSCQRLKIRILLVIDASTQSQMVHLYPVHIADYINNRKPFF